jgi:hypothetical protein
MMTARNGQTGNKVNGNGQGNSFCRAIVATIAAMLALRICEYIIRKFQG